MSKANEAETKNIQTSTDLIHKKNFQTKPIINSKFYFSKDGKYLIFEKTEKHIFPASYHLKLLDNEIVKNKGEQQCAN